MLMFTAPLSTASSLVTVRDELLYQMDHKSDSVVYLGTAFLKVIF